METLVALESESIEATLGIANMGKVVVEVELVNTYDEEACRLGHLKAAHIRRTKLKLLVDTGSTAMSIPEDEIKKLGLPLFKKVSSRFANGQVESRNVYGPVKILLMNRAMAVATLVAAPGTPSLLGQIPLEGLDLMVDSKHQRLIPGHPDSPDEQVWEEY